MHKLAQLTLAASLLLVPALVVAQSATPGAWLTARSAGANADAAQAVGAVDGIGFKDLPARMITLNIGGKQHPLCLTGSQPGWAGIGKVVEHLGKKHLSCESGEGSVRGGWVFEYAANKPAPVWINTSASTPEPQGAIEIGRQGASNRPLYACQFDKSGKKYVGHIADDGKCKGAALDGSRDAATSYLTLVKKGTGADAQPRYGWVDAGRGFMPHGQIADAGVDGVRGGRAYARALCRVQDGGHAWPGWIDAAGNCEYFTYFGNNTTRKTASKFEVFRIKPGAAAAPYVFNRFGGKDFYACTAQYTLNGSNRTVIFGFTNNSATCTDGKHSTDVNPEKFGGWTKIRMVQLFNDGGDRA